MAADKPDFVLRVDRSVSIAGQDSTPFVVAVKNGNILSAGSELPREDVPIHDFPGAIILPGLIDLHAHAGIGLSKYGVDPDSYAPQCGTTTIMSQGDAGADNVSLFDREVRQASKTRILLAINLARAGEQSPSGCLSTEDAVDLAGCIRAIESRREWIWGISVNLSPFSCGDADPRKRLDEALTAAQEAKVPLLVGPRRGKRDFPLDQLLDRLRPGDVITYCFHDEEESIVEQQYVRPCVWDARAKGILFDVGPGRSSCCDVVAGIAIQEGFLPDTISSDYYLAHQQHDPAHSLLRTMSKLMQLGMLPADIYRAATIRPAQILGRVDQFGQISPGLVADLTVLRILPAYERSGRLAENLAIEPLWECLATIRSGEFVFQREPK